MTSQDIYEVLKARGVKVIFHANSVKTSISQLHLGGLASRQTIEYAQLPQTNQITDSKDRKLGIWNDVFLDTVDIHRRIRDRNKYGPVLFELKLDMLLSLPSSSRVLVTRSNPSKWKETDSDADCYFLNALDLQQRIEIGNFDHMLVIRTESGFIPFSNAFQKSYWTILDLKTKRVSNLSMQKTPLCIERSLVILKLKFIEEAALLIAIALTVTLKSPPEFLISSLHEKTV